MTGVAAARRARAGTDVIGRVHRCSDLDDVAGHSRQALASDGTDGEDATGVLVLDAADDVESANRAADAWLDELGAGNRPPNVLPTVVRAVAAQTRQVAAGGETLPRARVLTRAGRCGRAGVDRQHDVAGAPAEPPADAGVGPRRSVGAHDGPSGPGRPDGAAMKLK